MNTNRTTKKRSAITIFLVWLALAASCEVNAPTRVPRQEQPRAGTDTVSIFLTGNVFGTLKPCGCSGGQLGGLDRRPAIINAVPRQKRLVLDTGSIVRDDSEQELIKYNILMQAMDLLEYDLVNLTEKDLEIARNLGLLDSLSVAIISPYGTGELTSSFQKQYALDGENITITVVTLESNASIIGQIQRLFPPPQGPQKNFNILLVSRCDDAVITSISKTGIVDCVICPAESDEPMVIGSPNRRPLVISVGQFGRYMCELRVKHAETGSRLKLSYRKIAVKEDLPKDASLVSLYKDYQQIVKDRNLLEKYPRLPLPDSLAYTGSKSCRPCHQAEYAVWKGTGHAQAYATLEEAGSQFDPECIVCHVVGMEYESGFVSEEQTSHLANVDCETCHGPGSEHAKTFGTAKFTEPKRTCTDCHTPEHSGEYAGNERAFLKKIIHWTEPNQPGNVK